MKITYTGPSESVGLDYGEVARGESIDVPDDVAKSLIDAGDFKPAKPGKTATTEDEA